MDWMSDIWGEALLALLGVVLTALLWGLRRALEKLWSDKAQEETVRKIAKTCVCAAEQMFCDLKGEEKLSQAISIARELLEKKGIRLSEREIRVFLEAALAELKGVFQIV